MHPEDFWTSGVFRAAIERIRGTQSASTTEKRDFMALILDHMKSEGAIADWDFTGAADRHDYQIKFDDGWLCVVEAKGCLDGNNTNIFERPANADEFLIWSLCQNSGSDPRHNAWSGIHTRLGAEIIHRQQRVDGLVVWDMLCGTKGRPCPKLDSEGKVTQLSDGRFVPPPCLFLFPRTIPDPRNNPSPPSWSLSDVRLLSALATTFTGTTRDVVSVEIHARAEGADVQRKTMFTRDEETIAESRWTCLRRARR